MATIDVTSEIIIHSTLENVSEYSTNPDNAPIWYDNIKSVIWETEPPLKVGSRIAFVAHFLGRRLTYSYEISEYIPQRKLVMQTAEGPFPMETTYMWEVLQPDRIKMTLRNQGSPSGFSGIFRPFMTRTMKKINRKDLEKLKQILEGKQD